MSVSPCRALTSRIFEVTNPTPREIRASREAAGLTQTQAGELVHAPLRAWQRWEAGDSAMHHAFWELFTLKLKSKRK